MNTSARLTLLISFFLASFAVHRADAQPAPAALPRGVAQDIIRDARKIVQPRGIEEMKSVRIGGIEQWISVRGRDRRNPILLFVHGGPAFAEMPASWLYQSPWEDYFTVVQWDQRGTGKTAAANDMKAVAPTINIERMTADGEELVTYLRKHYGKRKIFLLGHSWGSVIGLNIARKHPEWLHAYIGMGQVVDLPENEKIGFEFALRSARADNNAQAVRELEAIAPYPGPEAAISPERVMMQRKWLVHYGGMVWGRRNLDFEINARTLSPDYDDAELGAGDNGESLPRLLPALAGLDFRDVTALDIPTFLFAGRHDYATSSALAAAWFAKLKAPAKRLFWFEHSAHMMQFEQPGKMLIHLVRDIRPIAVKAGDAAPDDRPGVE